MKACATSLIYILSSLVFTLSLSSCGTDTGNPGLKAGVDHQAPMTSDDPIGYVLCSKISSCFKIDRSICDQRIYSATGITESLNLDVTRYPDLSSAISGLQLGTLITNSDSLRICQDAVTAMACDHSLLNQSYSIREPQNFNSAHHLLRSSASCENAIAP